MSLFDKYLNNCYHQEYGGGDSGGGTGNGDSGLYSLGSGANDNDFEPIDSSYRFTSPPRYYKANDPYYWEIDNIPLKQIHENCLWLKDQITGIKAVSGIGRDKFTELQPYATNSDRQIFVRPGNYTARVNDAFGKGILPRTGGSTADVQESIIRTTNRFDMPDQVFKALVGTLTTSRLYNTGLFDQVQHHSVRAVSQPLFNYLRGSTYSLNNPSPTGPQEANDLPKVKLALWKQINGNMSIPGYSTEDLQQLAVSFTRRWGGVVRTAVVSVSETLAISVPEFRDEDFLIDSALGGTPEVRMDLVFLYSHPIDQSQTTIVNGRLGGTETLTAPRLGIVKGAGAILSKAGDPDALDIISTPELIEDPAWAQQQNSNRFYNEEVNTADADASINASFVDNGIDPAYAPFPGKRVSSNFPSPDDLLNLAPLLADEIEEGSLSLVGQSILPICYVAVKRNASNISVDDIIDIRPFFRTTELAYNERAGVAAANPPLSFANPAVGQAQLENSLTVFKDYFVGGLLAQLEALASQVSEGTLAAQPQTTAVCAQNSAENQTNIQTLTTGVINFDDFVYVNNPGLELWESNVSLIQETAISPTTTVDSISLGPGVWEVSFDIALTNTDISHAETTYYWLTLKDQTDTVIYPNNTYTTPAGAITNGGIGITVAGDAGNYGDKEWNNSIHFKAIIENELTSGYSTYKVNWNRSKWNLLGGNFTPAYFNGTISIKRVSNVDGSLTPYGTGGGDVEP
tara:strand:- start:67 stop:2298 length:2232 start_codon:yes stop_codon:yes gene_type:complete